MLPLVFLSQHLETQTKEEFPSTGINKTWMSQLGFRSFCDKAPWPRATWGGKVFIVLQLVHHPKKKVQKPTQRNWRRSLGEVLLTDFLLKALPSLLFPSTPGLWAWGGISHSELGPPVLRKQEKQPEALPLAKQVRSLLHWGFLFKNEEYQDDIKLASRVCMGADIG